LKRIFGRLPTNSSPGWPRWPFTSSGRSGQFSVSSGSPRYTGASGSEASTDQFQTEPSSSSCGTPRGGMSGLIQSLRLAFVIVVPSGIVRPIRPAESTGVGGWARPGSALRLTCFVL